MTKFNGVESLALPFGRKNSNRILGLALYCFLWGCILWTSFAEAQVPILTPPTEEACASPNLALSSTLPPAVSTITVSNDLIIADMRVEMDIDHSFVHDLVLELISPAGTTLLLHENVGFGADNIKLTYWDFGEPNQAPYDCEPCLMQATGPGTLQDFAGESTVGNWTLTVSDIIDDDVGTLNGWCVQFYDMLTAQPVQAIRCEVAPLQEVALATWTNIGSYDSIAIFVDNLLVSTLPPTQQQYQTAALNVGQHVIGIEPILAGASLPRIECIFFVGDLLAISNPLLPINSNLGETEDTIVIQNILDITDMQVDVDIKHSWIGDLEINLYGPSGLSLNLHSNQGGSADDLRLSFWDQGAPYDSEDFDCECWMQPSQFGLEQWQNTSALGTWTIRVSDYILGDSGTLNSWRLRFFGEMSSDPLNTPFIRGDANSDAKLDIADAIISLQRLFAMVNPTIDCDDAFDANDDGAINIADPIHLLTYLFNGGQTPAPPVSYCGNDPSSDSLLCPGYDACP